MILRAFVGSRQRPQHFIIFLYGFRVPEREKLGDLFPVPSGVEDNSRAGTDTPAGGEGGQNLSGETVAIPHPQKSARKCRKFNARASEDLPRPRVVSCRHLGRRGNSIPAPGKRAEEMPQAEAEKCHPAGLDFPDFPEPLKREFLQLLHYTKNGEFSEFLDTVKRGFSSGDCATIGDTFSEREKLNFLQQ